MAMFNFNKVDEDWNCYSEGTRTSYLKGHVLQGDRDVSGEYILSEIASIGNSAELNGKLRSLNGFYSWVEQSQSGIRAAVDHVRSMPLFYGTSDGQFYISDNADWVRRQVNDVEMDRLAKEEFLLAGYVTGSDTLYPNVKQIQAGELIIARKTREGVSVEVSRYYQFLHTEPASYSESGLLIELESKMYAAIKRLINFAKGRQIVIPLSGGYDSRIIAALVKRFGYRNILAFTYGVPGNKEALYSKEVATALGIKWEFVEYSEGLWREHWAGRLACEYKKSAANHTSLPHVQDWLAVKNLVDKGLIDKDAVVVPGHSGDFVAGSHIPSFVFDEKSHHKENLYSTIIKDHLSNAPSTDMAIVSAGILVERIKNRIGIPFDGSDVEFANLYELWDWQERQSKYIVNSVRVYEQFGLSWWMPLWDLEFVQFWEKIPLIFRENRTWFKNWVSLQYAEEIISQSGSAPLNNAGDDSLIFKLVRVLVNLLPGRLKGSVKNIWRRITFGRHFLGFQGLIPDGESKVKYSKGYNVVGVYSDLYVNNRW
ncbi:asparagine synthase-related protein [Zhongshania aliphaticivorans]|uniref:asparagine synthase-related protein n=1 Tax=Zhongshania aliphaticivorans TaxID=1470434 RepID=UPI0039C9C514